MEHYATDIARRRIPPLPGKKGAAFTLRDEGQPGNWKQNLPKVIALRPYWNYSWGSKRIDAQPNDIEFVPMIWCGTNAERMKQSLDNDVVQHINNRTIHRILAFNEPDEKSQLVRLVLTRRVNGWHHSWRKSTRRTSRSIGLGCIGMVAPMYLRFKTLLPMFISYTIVQF